MPCKPPTLFPAAALTLAGCAATGPTAAEPFALRGLAGGN
jgi:hypothetical protein